MSLTDKKMDIVVIQLMDGSTLMGQIDSDAADDAANLALHNPAQVVTHQDREGTLSYGMMPYMAFKAGDTVNVNTIHIQVEAMPGENILSAYKKSVLGVKIELPERKLLLS